MRSLTVIRAELDEKKERLSLYKAMEANILKGLPMAYGLGSRNATRYNITIPQLLDAIKALETEIASLEAELAGGAKKRRAVGVIPRDW